MKRKLLIILSSIFALCIVFIFVFYFFFSTPESHEITLYGNVDIRQVDLGFRVDGRVEEMYVDEGDFVTTGELLARLEIQPYEDEVKEAVANVEALKASLANAQILYERRLALIPCGAVSQEDLDDSYTSRNVIASNLESSIAALGVAMKNLHDTKVYAPTEGWILTRIREPGTVVKEADPIYTLSVKTPVWIRAYIDEPKLGLIYPDMPAEIYTDTKGTVVYHGHIGFISPVAEFTPKTVESTELRTDLVYRLRVYVDDPDLALRQGMPVTVKLKPTLQKK